MAENLPSCKIDTSPQNKHKVSFNLSVSSPMSINNGTIPREIEKKNLSFSDIQLQASSMNSRRVVNPTTNPSCREISNKKREVGAIFFFFFLQGILRGVKGFAMRRVGLIVCESGAQGFAMRHVGLIVCESACESKQGRFSATLPNPNESCPTPVAHTVINQLTGSYMTP